jgi:hypothetical protein
MWMALGQGRDDVRRVEHPDSADLNGRNPALPCPPHQGSRRKPAAQIGRHCCRVKEVGLPEPRSCLECIVSIIRIHRRSFWVTWQVLVITRDFMSARVGIAMQVVMLNARILPGSGGSRQRLRPRSGSGLRNGIRGGQPAQRGERSRCDYPPLAPWGSGGVENAHCAPPADEIRAVAGAPGNQRH